MLGTALARKPSPNSGPLANHTAAQQGLANGRPAGRDWQAAGLPGGHSRRQTRVYLSVAASTNSFERVVQRAGLAPPRRPRSRNFEPAGCLAAAWQGRLPSLALFPGFLVGAVWEGRAGGDPRRRPALFPPPPCGRPAPGRRRQARPAPSLFCGFLSGHALARQSRAGFGLPRVLRLPARQQQPVSSQRQLHSRACTSLVLSPAPGGPLPPPD